MTSERNELADILAGWPIGDGYYGTTISVDEAHELADHIIASRKPCTVATADELNALPVGSVVKAHWADGSQPDYLAMRSKSGAASSAGAGVFGGKHWLGIAKWSAEITVLHVGGSDE